jgi:glycosyltransferase involved in cell wall biosynthesis
MTTRWAILTGEYPPQPGGVSDYTRLVANGLTAAHDEVRVFAPPHASKADCGCAKTCLCRLPDNFGPRGLPKLDLELRRYQPQRILIQYVPHAYGWKAMNLPFAVWVSARVWRFAPVWVMFHEVAFPFRWRPPAHAVLGTITRAMARLVAGAAERLFSSTAMWGPLIRKLCPRAKPVEWLPIPSNIPNDPDIEAVRSAPGTAIGHFGTYGPATAELLCSTLFCLLAKRDRSAILLGRGGVGFRDCFTARHPELCGRVLATGELPPRELAARLRGCDVLLQPFIDGISSRRTSAMAGLANGVPLVSNLGLLSESLWMDARGIALASSPNSSALAAATETVLALGDEQRAEMGRRAAALYREWFSLDRTLSALRAPWESQR